MRSMALLALSMLLAAAAVAQNPIWPGIQGIWRVQPGNELCPSGELWVYAFSDDGRNMVLWTQGSMLRAPVVIPDRLGTPPRLQGRAPFYNSRILERRDNMIRTRHETLRIVPTGLRIDTGNLVCYARPAYAINALQERGGARP